ncbi:hypothetical protein AMS68_007692 [Peltaster fructicola]|uniref:J domain-containing protein n=1 Tax=Peltaster fructicola TaxID=286661 RepID=A0A6H0Y5J5_9PEZI|nr:hypothetical protein AMS68_007692 [Peltaster fructicola]
MAKTVAEFQQERDPAQPKWMQSGSSSRDTSQPRAQRTVPTNVTDEAALLDMPRDGPPIRSKPQPVRPGQTISRERSPVPPQVQKESSARSSPQTFQDRRPASKLSRQEVEEQSAQAYISPARRKQAKPKPEVIQPEPEVDLFSPAPSQPVMKAATSVARPSPSPRPQIPTRTIPPAAAAALSTSAHHRKLGTEAFKRGDYGAAHEAYTSALQPLPATHPLVIVVLSNRSLTALKTGDAKTAISDADRALSIIGPGLGAGESIDFGGSEGQKEMRDFYGKALMRKAEALEHLEKWTEAAAVWRLAVEGGVGGAISLRGKDRCERAATPALAKPKTSTPAARATKAVPRPLGNSIARPALTTPTSDAAVQKLREANAAAERADDEKFQLADKVDAQLVAWKGGKADNLRALLQSLDAVLWESAGWKKVGMSDLVMPNKVKIIYMKAIAKVHPDKIAQDASTEQRMVSAAVFSTLNEAWDKFKKDNNL